MDVRQKAKERLADILLTMQNPEATFNSGQLHLLVGYIVDYTIEAAVKETFIRFAEMEAESARRTALAERAELVL